MTVCTDLYLCDTQSLWSSAIPFLDVPFRRTDIGKRSFSCAAPATCNSLPPAVINCDTLSHLLKVCCLGQSTPVAFWSLSAFEQLQGPHYQRHIRYLSGVWSGTTLRRASVQLSKPSDATYSARLVGQPGRSCRLPQPGQLTIGEERLGYHINNNTLSVFNSWLKTHLFNIAIASLPVPPVRLKLRLTWLAEFCPCSSSSY